MLRRLWVFAVPAVLVACQDVSSPAGPSGPGSDMIGIRADMATSPEMFEPGEVIFAVREGVDADEVARGHGLTAQRGHRGSFTVGRGAAGNEVALAARLSRDSRVRFAEPNYLRQTSSPVDARLWAFYNPGHLSVTFTRGNQRGLPVTSFLSRFDADVDAAPRGLFGTYGSGGATVLIGSIDSGVDLTHPQFFSGQLIAGRDWYANDDDPSDEDGHGTHTAGIMAGRTVGVAGVSGAGSNVQLFVQRVCGRRGCPSAAIANAIRAAADMEGMVAVNLSLGGTTLSRAESEAIAYATERNVLVVASAGNDGRNSLSCPACDPNVIAVAATNWRDELTGYSNRGEGLALSAPGGEMLWNATNESGILSSVVGGYAYYHGTSMAAPQVTGTAAVIASVSGIRGAELRERLVTTADDLGPAGYDTAYGFGRLNIYRAITGETIMEVGNEPGDVADPLCVPRGSSGKCR